MKNGLIMALFSSVMACAATRMNVYVCNQGNIPKSVVAGARREASAAFRRLAVEIAWKDCADDSYVDQTDPERYFVIRLRLDVVPMAVGPESLETMGRAYVADGCGYLADAYYRAIGLTAEASTSRSDVPEILGSVIAHELGHLLLGPGHSPSGIMRAVWRQRDIQGVRNGGLRFDAKQGQRIRYALGAASDGFAETEAWCGDGPRLLGQ